MKNTGKGLAYFTFLLLGLFPLFVGLSACEREPGPIPPVPPVDTVSFVRLLEKQTLKSRILNRDISYAVLLPKEYDSLHTSYPVVYLLHGFGDDETAWYKYGLISYYADANASIPMIYVMPQGFNSYYVNKYNGTFPYMDMFVNELVPTIDSLFRTIKDPQQRAVMGYSMGGYGALILPAKNSGVFKTGVVLSMSYRTDQQYMDEPQDGWNSQWGSVFGGIGSSGTARLTDYYKENNPFYFFKKPGDLSLNGQNYFFDCGDDEESLSEPNDALHDLLRDLNIKHEYRMKNGAHSWDYWHKALPEALRYISCTVQNIPYPNDPVPVDPGTAVPAGRTFAEQLEGTGITFSVTVPPTYLADTIHYAVILALHDRNAASQVIESQNLISLLNSNMISGNIPNSLIVEIPIQAETITAEALQQLLSQVRAKYRTIGDRNHTILLGNNQAGLLAFGLITGCSEQINACLLFDANIPEDAAASDAGISYYLDICDQGINYGSYHSLYLSLRHNQVNHEYRVRQGTPSHESFLNGLDESAGFMKTHLRN
ncbi:MAG: alpha/beta hydrolase family protein [Bacteroidota bacterium]